MKLFHTKLHIFHIFIRSGLANLEKYSEVEKSTAFQIQLIYILYIVHWFSTLLTDY